MIRILIVDDSASYRGLIGRLLERQDWISVIGEAGDGPGAIALARGLRPDVILMDYQMPGMDGVTAARAIKEELPDIKILIVTAHIEELMGAEALRSRLPVLSKNQPIEDIVGTIRMELGARHDGLGGGQA